MVCMLLAIADDMKYACMQYRLINRVVYIYIQITIAAVYSYVCYEKFHLSIQYIIYCYIIVEDMNKKCVSTIMYSDKEEAVPSIRMTNS